jgi:hypothetical protein
VPVRCFQKFANVFLPVKSQVLIKKYLSTVIIEYDSAHFRTIYFYAGVIEFHLRRENRLLALFR